MHQAEICGLQKCFCIEITEVVAAADGEVVVRGFVKFDASAITGRFEFLPDEVLLIALHGHGPFSASNPSRMTVSGVAQKLLKLDRLASGSNAPSERVFLSNGERVEFEVSLREFLDCKRILALSEAETERLQKELRIGCELRVVFVPFPTRLVSNTLLDDYANSSWGAGENIFVESSTDVQERSK